MKKFALAASVAAVLLSLSTASVVSSVSAGAATVTVYSAAQSGVPGFESSMAFTPTADPTLLAQLDNQQGSDADSTGYSQAFQIPADGTVNTVTWWGTGANQAGFMVALSDGVWPGTPQTSLPNGPVVNGTLVNLSVVPITSVSRTPSINGETRFQIQIPPTAMYASHAYRLSVTAVGGNFEWDTSSALGCCTGTTGINWVRGRLQSYLSMPNVSFSLDNSTTPVPLPPLVTTTPAGTVVTVGQSYSFTASASGSPTPTVQWQLSTDGGATYSDIPGATSATYSAVATPADNAHWFRAVFTNTSGSVTTGAAGLTVTPAPVAPLVTTSPTGTTAGVGQSYSFAAAASGIPSPTVQWQRSNDGGLTWASVVGATSPTYSAVAVPGDDGAQFRAVFTNSQGTATTTPATLSVPLGPVVTTSPLAVTVAAGAPYGFSAAASGYPTPTVQWQRSDDNGLTWNPIAGATAPSYSATAAAGDQGAQFEAVFTNASGTATSAPAVLYVTVAPVVTTAPAPTSVAVGGSYSFTTTATGQPAPTVQWQRSGDNGVTWGPVSGALTTVNPGVTTSSYTATAAAADGGAQFRAVFTNSTGAATTAPATLSVTMAPLLVSSPVSQTINAGTAYTFMAVAYGIPGPTAQWQRSNDGGTSWTDIPGANSSSYTVIAALGDNGARFRAVFTNSTGTVTTAIATLGVTTTTSMTLKSAHPSIKGGKKDALTATVSSPVTGKGKVGSGTVTFYDGSTAVATATVAKGKATVAVTLATGTHLLRAAFSGSGSVLPAQSSVVTVTAT